MRRALALGTLGIAAFCAPAALAQSAPPPSPTPTTFEIYGFGQADVIYDVNRVDPDWNDAFRPSKIATTDGQFGSDGQTSISAKQSRFGAKANGQAADHPYEVKFEFDLFGTGVDAGQTTFRLRHAYGRWGPILGGQTNSLFMDADLFPNVIDYWGPTGMVFLRNPQVRFYIVDKPNFLVAVAVEKPGNDVDAGGIRQIDPELAAGLSPTQRLPDFSAQLRWMNDKGHVQLSGIVRDLGYETVGAPDSSPKGSVTGWGIDVGTSYRFVPAATVRVGVVYGEGIANYMNDGGTDLAPNVQIAGVAPNRTIVGVQAKAVPLLGVTAYLDYQWTDTLSTAIGYSLTQVNNTNFQEGDAYEKGEYASVNLLWAPNKHIMTGGEVMWGKRTDNDGRSGDDVRLQYSFKVSFSSNDFFGK